MLHLYPTSEHPAGSQDKYWFILIADLIFPSSHHPSGIHGFPWFKRDGDNVYIAYGHPDNRGDGAPYFTIRGEFFYRTESETPWFRIENPGGATAEKQRLIG